jgi:peptide subunit release factor 1 (eRF1)
MKISVLVPKGKNVDKERAFLRSEIAEAKSIKSSTNRDSVTRGL